jgi:trans-2,3-dihydro-3-hydroxyanthranilate isomerase
MQAKLVDVFSANRFSGNGLTIFDPADNMTTRQMLSLTREMRQFESIFLWVEKGGFRARIFTTEEELDFAGHPLIGLAAYLHEKYGDDSDQQWRIQLNNRVVVVDSRKSGDYFEATMNQGKAEFIKQLDQFESELFLQVLNLSRDDVADHPLEVVSTGLPYLIVPLHGGLERARICIDNLEELLSAQGAKFVYLLDIDQLEGRSWDNSGKVEDIATGSAAGPATAFLFRHGLIRGNQPYVIHQGRFLERPSEIWVLVKTQGDTPDDILVSGQVCKVANINFV